MSPMGAAIKPSLADRSGRQRRASEPKSKQTDMDITFGGDLKVVPESNEMGAGLRMPKK